METSKEVNLMRVKFFEYLTTKDKMGRPKTNMAGKDDTPLPHCINDKNYFPTDILGNFQEF
jgi:hypothetical protein